MDISKALETATVEETLFVWMAIHGNLCLALRHPGNSGPSRDYIEQFVAKLGEILVERGLLTATQMAHAMRLEREMCP